MSEYFFVFLNCPDYPVMVYAVYPASRQAEAFEFANRSAGYFLVRKAKWNMGGLPELKDTEEA